MLTARKVAQEQGLEKVADHSSDNFECRKNCVFSSACNAFFVLNDRHPGIPSGYQQWSGGLPVSVPSAHSRPRRSPAQLAPWLNLIRLIRSAPLAKSFSETTFCNLLICHGFILCFCTQGLENNFALFLLPLPLPKLIHQSNFMTFVQAFFTFAHPILPIIISEHVDKGGLPTPNGQTFCEFPCIVYTDWSSSILAEQILLFIHSSHQKL